MTLSSLEVLEALGIWGHTEDWAVFFEKSNTNALKEVPVFQLSFLLASGHSCTCNDFS